MRSLLVWLKHLFILLPSIATMFITFIPSTSEYVSYILLALLIVRITAFAPRFVYLLLPVQMIGFGWLAYTYGGILYFLVYSGLISAYLYFRRPVEIASMVLLSGIIVNSVTADSAQASWIANLVWIGFTLLLTVIFNANRMQEKLERKIETLTEYQDQLEQERARAMEYARKVEGYAQVQERGRIATELHDDLGHRLIRVKMMTEAALQLMEQHPQQAIRMVEQVRGQLEESMNNMRYTVRKLQPVEKQNARQYGLHRLIEDAARDLQIEVSFELKGKPFPLYPSIEFVLYRNAQEAITNAVRHGGASAVEITLDFYEAEVIMNVKNNGSIPESVSDGLGLKGMKDRLTVIGGQLQVSLENGFVISTMVPIHEASQRAEGE
ncbi:sensor histidine kinase [Cohnella mopanensis]|uniref:sensor histidine kinase n=1 Tax=Cohnella mopanensis TaxID=2911966 RepID=UPI001EF76F1F|nr:sensor histidine kinase [Cohnella mopanensis]